MYVSITHPQETRKALLEAAKATIRLIQLNDSIRAIRSKKKELLLELEEQLAGIVGSFSRLKSYYPKVKMSDLPKLRNVKTESLWRRSENLDNSVKPLSSFQKKEQRPPQPVHISPEQKLEVELRSIEEKLRDLNI